MGLALVLSRMAFMSKASSVMFSPGVDGEAEMFLQETHEFQRGKTVLLGASLVSTYKHQDTFSSLAPPTRKYK